MLLTIVSALLPVLFTVGLGYAAAKAHAFPADAVAVISKLVLDFALPAGLFVSTVTVSRAALLAEAPLVLELAAVTAAIWIGGFVLGRTLFGNDTKSAGLQALTVAFPAIPFYGITVIGTVFGAAAGVSVSMGAMVVNLIPLPATMVVLSLGTAKAGADGRPSAFANVGQAIWKALKTPYVISPIVGILLVLAGLTIPKEISGALAPIGTASSGIGVFVAGLTLANVTLKLSRQSLFNVIVKLAVMPVLFFGGSALLGLTHTIADPGLVLASLPCGPISVLLATRYNAYKEEASTALALTTLGFIVTLPVLLLVTHAG